MLFYPERTFGQKSGHIMDEITKPLRRVVQRRRLILGTLTASLVVPVAQAAPIVAKDVKLADHFWLAAGKGAGEGESEGGRVDPAITDLRDLGLAEAHLRAALALFALAQGEAATAHLDLAAAMEVGDAADAVLNGAVAAIRDGAEAVALAPIADYRAAQPEITRIAALIALTRAGADLYAQAGEADPADQQTTQMAWGVMETVRAGIDALTASADPDVVQVAEKMHGYLDKVAAGSLGDMPEAETDPGVIYGAAARMELAAARLK